MLINSVPVNSRLIGHIKFLYDLLKRRPRKANISHSKMPTFKQHVAFVKMNPYLEWRIYWGMATDYMGAAYITRQNEIGIFLTRKYQGKGYAAEVLRDMEGRAHGRILANISPRNERSIRFFVKNGYKLIQHTYQKTVK